MSQYLTLAQAREALGVSPFVFNANFRPQLTEIKRGERTILFPRVEIEALTAEESGLMWNKKKVRDALNHTWELKWRRAKGSTKKEYIKKVVDKELGDEPLSKTDYERIVRWVEDMRRRDLAVATIRARLSCLMYALKEAAKLGWIKTVPDTPELEAANARTRYLADTPDEEAMLIEACGHLDYHVCDVMRRGIVILLDTGCRLSELVKTRSEHVGDKGVIFDDRKAGDSLRVPLTAAAREAIDALLADRYWMRRVRGAEFSKKRCESAVCWFSHQFIKVRNKAGLRDVTVHTLRHTFASRVVQSGVSIYEVQKLLGHASITQTERYAHLAPNSLDKSLRVLENRRLPSKVEPIRGPKR